ncbi:alpha/beta fold hydrolase [uncultured Paracoccus sp.]|uniref:alpha/beta fold hydrolase n=1 Tax=uncultured Paracoccus sp. TaxID=189685 RepID=UPI00262A8C3C|nr:alpha/beta fold hydrolase [uncultured Paracoccus sp.]
MTGYALQDFGGTFLTTERRVVDGETYPGISAYVEWFIPEHPRALSVTFVHGGGGQGSEFLRTPDGRPGWVHAFLRAGFPVHVLDRPGHGRNSWNPKVLGSSLPAPSYEFLYPRFVEPARAAPWPGADRHSRWPETPVAGDRFMASQGPMATTLEASQRHVEAIATQLFQLTGPTVLVSHSAGGPLGWALAAMGGDQVAAILAIEPLGEPGLQHALGRFDNGLSAVAFAGPADPYARPIAVVSGEATWMRANNARAADFLARQGHDAEHIRLEEHGITGNGHMMMSETNSDQIAAFLIGWLTRRLGLPGR